MENNYSETHYYSKTPTYIFHLCIQAATQAEFSLRQIQPNAGYIEARNEAGFGTGEVVIIQVNANGAVYVKSMDSVIGSWFDRKANRRNVTKFFNELNKLLEKPEAPLLDYILAARPYRSRYEIDRELLHQGYTPQVLEVAWNKSNFSIPRLNSYSSILFWLVYLLTLLFSFGIAIFAPYNAINRLALFGLFEGISLIAGFLIRPWSKIVSKALIYACVTATVLAVVWLLLFTLVVLAPYCDPSPQHYNCP